jgi:hypothetical protein
VDPEEVNYRDSRGIPRALLHDNRGAIEDFKAYVSGGAPAFIPERRKWIEILRAGKNPMDAATLERLRSETSLYGWAKGLERQIDEYAGRGDYCLALYVH